MIRAMGNALATAARRTTPTTFLVETAWGPVELEASGPVVSAVRPPRPADLGQGVTPHTGGGRDLAEAHPHVSALARRIVCYFDGEPVDIFESEEQVAASLEAAGVSGFRRDVSIALWRVPRGVTISYGELAAIAGRPGAARAAGGTCARNPLPILVPCHRVLHAGARPGDVGSYGAGSGPDYKRRLLALEGAAHVRPA